MCLEGALTIVDIPFQIFSTLTVRFSCNLIDCVGVLNNMSTFVGNFLS